MHFFKSSQLNAIQVKQTQSDLKGLITGTSSFMLLIKC